MALAWAVALQTGAYDAAVTGVSRDVALARALKLIRSLAYRLSPESLGDSRYHWQSAMYAAHAGLAGWLLWDDLPEADRVLVEQMVLVEANKHRNPVYYRGPSGSITSWGDTKSEEQAWNAYVLSLAAMMMPDHPNVDTWKTSNIHLMLSTFSRPEDLSSGDVYHGHPLSDWLEGSNIYNDGTVVNHSIVHPDYMASGTVEFNPGADLFLGESADARSGAVQCRQGGGGVRRVGVQSRKPTVFSGDQQEH